jgi:hypothetical protein
MAPPVQNYHAVKSGRGILFPKRFLGLEHQLFIHRNKVGRIETRTLRHYNAYRDPRWHRWRHPLDG